MKYPVVATLTGQGLSVTRVCKLLGLSRSGFYAWADRLVNPCDQQLRRNELLVVIKGIHANSRNTYGSRRVHAELTMGLGIQVSKPTVEKIMRSNGIFLGKDADRTTQHQKLEHASRVGFSDL